jgi:phage terminase large subunit
MIIVYALTNNGKVVSIVRKSMPALRSTVMRDFFSIMKELQIYDRNSHNKTENIYTFPTGTIVEFFSVDDEQKVRGRKRDILWANEANELWLDDFNQLNWRTEGKMIFDYNPSDLSGYLYELAERENAKIIKSTYRDNPFLSQRQIDELEFLKHTDPDSYKIYNLGERAQTSEHVLKHWKIAPKPEGLTQTCYGLDFGWNHPMALVRVWHDGSGKRFHFEQIIHQSEISIEEVGEIMKDEVGMSDDVMADSARPDAIRQLSDMGFAIHNSDKSVKKGLEVMKTSIITIDPDSLGLIRDFENYKFKKIRGILTDEVKKVYDDGPDAARYACVWLRSLAGGMEFSTMRF